MIKLILLLATVSLSLGQFFTGERAEPVCKTIGKPDCNDNVIFATLVDGVRTLTSCNDGFRDPNFASNCDRCCKAFALSRMNLASRASGSISASGRQCSCCQTNCLS